MATVFEDVVRQSVSRSPYGDQAWGPAASWWEPGLDRSPMEIDVVAESEDGSTLLVDEVKWSRRVDWKREEATLRHKAENLALARGREVQLALWAPSPPRSRGHVLRCGASHVLDALR